MRTVLFNNDMPIGVFALTTKDSDHKALQVRKSMMDPRGHYNLVRVPTIRADGSVMTDLRQAAEIAQSVAADELREQLMSCYEDWLEVCHAVTGQPGHLNPDVLIAKIKELRG